MNLKTILMWVLIFLCPYFANAQKISLGEKLPDMELFNIVNYRSDKLKIADFKGKLVILDFWNHHCSACIKSFPKLDSLQRIFNNDIQIILVNSESKDSTRSFFKKRPRIKQPELIMITGDRQLSEMFPAEGYPYCVWIDSSGIIRNFSGSHVITALTISKFLSGSKLSFVDPTKKRVGSPINFREFQYLSYISPCNDTMYIGNSEKVYTEDSSHVHISSNCASVVELFTKAYNEKGKYNFNTAYGLDIKVTDSIKYIKPLNSELIDSWSATYGHNYELYLSASQSGKAYKTMQEDLERHFPVKAYIKEKLVRGIVLVADDTMKIQTKGGKPFNSFSTVEYGKSFKEYRILINQPLFQLTEYLRLWIQYYYPFHSDVRLLNNIDIRIREKSINPLNINFLNEDLSKYGLKLIFLEMPIPVLHLEEQY